MKTRASSGESGAGAQHPRPVKVDLRQVEEAAKELYIRALKELPPDIKQGFERLAKHETTPAQSACSAR